MIDEKPHYPQPDLAARREQSVFSQENVHPSKVLFNVHQVLKPGFRSQEPRRPRFSFFYLHNVKELTIPPSPASIVIKGHALSIPSKTKCRPWLPSSTSCLFQKIRQQWEEQSSTSSTWPGCTEHRFQCQQPIFVFRSIQICIWLNRNLKPENQNFFSFSVVCFVARRRLAPRPEAMTGL